MIYTENVKKAMILAESMHRNQYDRGGFPYINHPLHIAEGASSEDATILALLHDTVEDHRILDSDVVYKDKLGDNFDTESIINLNQLLSHFYANNLEELAIDTLCDQFGFNHNINKAWKLLTHNKNKDTYDEYISKIKTDKLATEVKLLDLRHNLTVERLLGKELKSSLKTRYMKAISELNWRSLHGYTE